MCPHGHVWPGDAPTVLAACRAGSRAERQAWAVPGVCAARPGWSKGQGARGTSALCRILGFLLRAAGRGGPDGEDLGMGVCGQMYAGGRPRGCVEGVWGRGSWVRPPMSPPVAPASPLELPLDFCVRNASKCVQTTVIWVVLLQAAKSNPGVSSSLQSKTVPHMWGGGKASADFLSVHCLLGGVSLFSISSLLCGNYSSSFPTP